MAVTPNGGQTPPNSILGARLLWKNIQKKERKNKISEVINKSIPKRNPFITLRSWNPWKEPSREMSRHHMAALKVKIILLIMSNVMFFLVMSRIIPINLFIVKNPVSNGHGLGEIIWKGWNCLIISGYTVSLRYIDSNIVKT